MGTGKILSVRNSVVDPYTVQKNFVSDSSLYWYQFYMQILPIPQAEEGLSFDGLKELALKRYQQLSGSSDSSAGVERLMSGSDDFTLFLWSPEKESKPIARLTGHMQLVNDVKFSPGIRIIAMVILDMKTNREVHSLFMHNKFVFQMVEE